MKIYIDFDRTLFDCDKFIEDFYVIISKYNIPHELFKECQNQTKENGFNPYTILSGVGKTFSFDKAIYKDIDKFLNDTSMYLYDDSIHFLSYLNKLNYEIIILSKGNKDFQKNKIINSHIDNYYSKLIVTMEKKGLLSLDYVNAIFIDDDPREIDSLYQMNPKKLICIRRPNSKYIDIKLNKSVLSFSNLQEVIDNKILD